MLNLFEIIFKRERFNKKVLDCIANQLEDLGIKLERIERTMTTKAEAQAIANQLNKALNEITGEMANFNAKITDLETKIQNGEDVSEALNEIKAVAQRLDDVVKDATPEQPTEGEDTQTAPGGEDTLPTGEGEDTLGGETGEDTANGQNGQDVV